MSDEEIYQLIEMKVEMSLSITQAVREAFQKMEDLIQNKWKENSKHYHFKTRKEMEHAMMRDYNPYSTFSYGKEQTKESICICGGKEAIKNGLPRSDIYCPKCDE